MELSQVLQRMAVGALLQEEECPGKLFVELLAGWARSLRETEDVSRQYFPEDFREP